MPEAKLKWQNASAENPGFTVWHATPERDPRILYAIRRKRAKRGFKPTIWRVFVRNNPTDPLHTIFVADTVPAAKKFVQELEDVVSVSIEAVPTPDL